MDKINQHDLQQALVDVRKSYRLLAVYQRRILDTVKFIANHYSLQLQGGYSKFSNIAKKGKGVQLTHWSWDWLSMYLYEFNLGYLEIDDIKYHFKLIHQADTGFYDVNDNQRTSKTNPSEFAASEKSECYLFFVVSKNTDGCPIERLLKDYLHKESIQSLKNKNNWFYAKYKIDEFINQDTTENVFKDFNKLIKLEFGLDLTKEIQLSNSAY